MHDPGILDCGPVGLSAADGIFYDYRPRSPPRMKPSMRAFPLIALVLIALAPAVGAQDTINDAEFGFSMELPDGLRELTQAELAVALGIPPDQASNPARDSSAEGIVSHYYMWIDETSPYNRQIGIILRDGAPPFTRPDAMFEATARSGLQIDQSASGPMAPPVDGLKVVGSFPRQQDGLMIRKVILYLPDFAGEHYATVNLQAFEADWPIVEPQFEAVLQSVRFRRTPMPQGGGRAGTRASADVGGAGGKDPGDWGSLPVAGTLLLAFAMLAHLFVGGRGTR